MDKTQICDYCSGTKGSMKRGWTNGLYCSEDCERSALIQLHSSMPGAGKCTSLPTYLNNEVTRRWADD